MRPLPLKVDSKRLPVTTQGEYLQYAESVRNTELGKMGAGLTAEQIKKNPELKNILGTFMFEHPRNIY